MEINTRIQVEHTVIKEVTGIDIVRWQMLVAAGHELLFEHTDVDIEGHVIEHRINAENPANDFVPTPGPLETYDPPSSIGMRLDHAVSYGDEIGGNYDSMIAKLVVRPADRDRCLECSRRALEHFTVEGVHTTIPFHRLMLEDAVFLAGEQITKYLDSDGGEKDIAAAVERRGGETATSDGSDTETHELTVEVDD